MSTKRTLQEIQNTLRQISNGDATLLSTEYINNKSLLRFRCKCGNTFERSYNNLLRGCCVCKTCLSKAQSKRCRKDFEMVKQKIRDHGCEYVSGEYVNSSSKLLLKCSCGRLFKKDMSNFNAGQNRCRQCGEQIRIQQKTKYDFEYLSSFLTDRGYTLLEKEFKGYSAKHLCMCSNGHKCYAVLQWMMSGQGACKRCAYEKHRGKNSHLYIDGSTTINALLRTPLKAWRQNVRTLYHDTCPITGLQGKDCDIHHIIPVKTLFNNICNKYNKQIHLEDTIHDFNNNELFNKIRNDFIKEHTPDIGIVLSKKIHKHFHSLYLRKQYGIKEFEQFLKDYYNVNLYDILIIQNQNTILLSS